MKDYNTQRPTLILKEYGRNIQKLVDYVRGIGDREKRNDNAEILVELMRQLNPNVKDTETSQKLWDDLFIMADFKIEVDSPFPIPEKELLRKKPKRLRYSPSEVKFKHYGRNIELLIKKAMDIADPKEQEEATIYIGKLMKGFHMIWNRENPDDSTIIHNIKTLSSGVLDLDVNKVKENNLFEVTMKEPRQNDNRDRDRRDRNKGGKRNRGNQNRRRRN